MSYENISLRWDSAEPRGIGGLILEPMSNKSVLDVRKTELSLFNSRKAVWATFRDVGHAKQSQFPPLYFLHSQAALEIMEPIQVDRSTGFDVRVKTASRIEPAVVISSNDNLDLMGLALEPVDLLLDVCSGSGVGQVASVDENVTWRDINELVVSVGDADDADGWSVTRGNEWAPTEEEQDVVELDGDEGQWREEELVEEGEALPLVLPAEAEEREQAHAGAGVVMASVGKESLLIGRHFDV
jgi:hypothetical protein